MANKQIVNFLNDFSVEVTPNAANKIENFSDYLLHEVFNPYLEEWLGKSGLEGYLNL